jgi:hypothetical protein
MRGHLLSISSAVAVGLLLIGAVGCGDDLEQVQRNLEKAEKKLERLGENNPRINRKVNALPMGISTEEVITRLGHPDGREASTSGGSKSEHLYYGQWRLSFTDGELHAKRKF